jgi:anionic cell wall polymer biosynthesis LytR-Cps2A-Psr (LCP) family protein
MTIIGFVPDFYVSINYNAFTRIINAVGGIEIDVPFHMRYDDPTDGLRIDIRAGRQTLNGETALQFARFRRANPGFREITDYGRMANQQLVIHATLRQLLRPASLLRIPEFIDIFQSNVHSDLALGNMIWFADELNKIQGTDALHTYTIPVIGTSGLPMYYELLDAEAIVELINRTINPYTKNIEVSDLDIITGY